MGCAIGGGISGTPARDGISGAPGGGGPSSTTFWDKGMVEKVVVVVVAKNGGVHIQLAEANLMLSCLPRSSICPFFEPQKLQAAGSAESLLPELTTVYMVTAFGSWKDIFNLMLLLVAHTSVWSRPSKAEEAFWLQSVKQPHTVLFSRVSTSCAKTS